MKRSRIQYLLEDYASGDIDDVGRAEVEALLERDPALRERVTEMREANDALLCMRERPAPPVTARDVLPSIQAAIAAASFESKPKLYLESSSTRFYRRIALAAVVMLAVGGGVVVMRALDDTDAPQAPSAESDFGEFDFADTTSSRPSPAERGLERFVDASHRGPINGEEFRRMVGSQDPNRILIVPRTNVLPVVAGATESDYR